MLETNPTLAPWNTQFHHKDKVKEAERIRLIKLVEADKPQVSGRTAIPSWFGKRWVGLMKLQRDSRLMVSQMLIDLAAHVRNV